MKKGKSGFTLFEVLAVVLIIGILAALLLPALSKAKTKALSIKCQSNLRQLGIMLRMYVDGEGHYPGRYNSSSAHWQYAIGARRITAASGPVPPKLGTVEATVAQCPSAPSSSWEDFLRPSYGYNALDGSPKFNPMVDPPYGRGLGGAPGAGGLVLVTDSAVLNPSDTYAIGDSFASTEHQRVVYGNGQIGKNWSLPEGNEQYYLEGERAARKRHGGRLNVVLCDGHVESLTIQNFLLNNEDRWKRRWHVRNEP